MDKASGNFAFICKKFYFMRLANELGLDNLDPGNDTYSFVAESEAEICDRIVLDMQKFRIGPIDKEKKLALLYQIPKFHKNPPKMRYIAGNVETVTSKLDRVVALILKMSKSHFMNLCKKSGDFSGRRYCFDVQTSVEVKGMFDDAHGVVGSISINDFSTLYTLFDHGHLIGNISWLLGKLCKNSGFQHVRVGYDKAWWVRGDSEGDVYCMSEVIEMVEYLVRESYIKAFGYIFRQVRGIIMGGKSSGWLSDCSLMVDEFKFVDRKVKAGLADEADSLRYFRRYRDDCTSLNIDNFMNIASQIYPPSLTLTQENDSLDSASVLDMDVRIVDGCIVTKVFCKTDLFPFEVISLPFLESNLDSGLCYRVFYGQVIRFQRLCTFRSGFEERTKFLADILIQRGYNRKRLLVLFCKAVEKYISEFQKWALPLNFSSWFSSILDFDTNLDDGNYRQSVWLDTNSASQSGSLFSQSVSQSVSLNTNSVNISGNLFSQS